MDDENIIPAVRLDNLQRRPIRKILIVKLRAIGDVLLSTAVIRNLREAFPEAQIDFLTEHPAREIIESNTELSNALIYHQKNSRLLPFCWKLWRERYDLVLDLFCNPRSAQFVWATKAPIRVGYPFRGRKYAYNHYVQSRSNDVHNVEFNLDPLRALNIPVVSTEPVFAIPEEKRLWAEDLLNDVQKPIIALNPSGTWETKRWGLEKFAALADLVAERRDATPLLIWGPGEEQDVQQIAEKMSSTPFIPPKTSLTELAALLSRCDAMISNDSGPMHIGASVGIPVLGIFGPTNPYLQGPYNSKSNWIRLNDLDCIACGKTSCDIGTVCMKELPVETVFSAFVAMMPNEIQ